MATQKKTTSTAAKSSSRQSTTNRSTRDSAGVSRKTPGTRAASSSSNRKAATGTARKKGGSTRSVKEPVRTTKSNSRGKAGEYRRTLEAPLETMEREPRVSRREVRQRNSMISNSAEITIWIMLAFCIILCLANFFGMGGFFGRGISYFFFGLFGLVSYLIPFILFIGTAFVAVNLHSHCLWEKVLAFLILLMTLSCFCELITGEYDSAQSLLSYYETGAELHTGGGFFGGIICFICCPLVGTIGTWICNIILFIISLIWLTGKSALESIYNGGKIVVDNYQSASYERRRTVREPDLQEYKEARRNRVISGVSMDTKLSSTEEAGTDMHEIIPRRNPDGKIRRVAGATNAPDVKVGFGEPSRAKKMVEAVDPIKKPVLQMEFPISGVVHNDDQEENATTIRTTVTHAAAIQKEEEDQAGVIVKKTDMKLKQPKSSREEQEQNVMSVEQEIRKQEQAPKKIYQFPPLSLLGKGSGKRGGNSTSEVRETAAKLQSTLESFGVNATITNVSCGPAVTRYELTPEQGVKVSKIVNLADDIKLNLAAADIRIEAPIPGKSAIGIEVPNKENSAVYLRELLETDKFKEAQSNLSFAVGKDIAGQAVVTDIAKMPHLLIAGATGSGKSVCINTLIMSILYKANPEDVKLIMIDPKVVELSVYNGIPHLLIPVVTDPKKASGALNWGVAEMTARYEKFSVAGVRDLKGYNAKVAQIPDGTEGKPERLPQIVIIVDELADLMMVAPGEVEDAICRLAQLARAAGIHLIIATQRPSVNVITGLIKANMPSRIAFSVTSGVDSRTILDMNGAEKLLGKGDMLFYPQGYPKPIRVQGAFVTDDEVGRVTAFLKENLDKETFGNQQTIDIDKFSTVSNSGSVSSSDGGNGRDEYFTEAGKFIIEKDKASIGMLQRVFKIGFNRAARIMDQLADAGVVGPEEGTKPRRILMSMEEFEQYVDECV